MNAAGTHVTRTRLPPKSWRIWGKAMRTTVTSSTMMNMLSVSITNVAHCLGLNTVRPASAVGLRASVTGALLDSVRGEEHGGHRGQRGHRDAAERSGIDRVGEGLLNEVPPGAEA